MDVVVQKAISPLIRNLIHQNRKNRGISGGPFQDGLGYETVVADLHRNIGKISQLGTGLENKKGE